MRQASLGTHMRYGDKMWALHSTMDRDGKKKIVRPEALAKLNKTGTSANPGSESGAGARVQNVLKRLDSCFRRNDGEGLLQEAHQ